ncbi:MAG: DEAD/DEAH box helicase family protein, partial [Bryobacteraceae bacterium]|nr:DEAD/DEAH box helicase family protein [Bryobacteraceae bacterium]
MTRFESAIFRLAPVCIPEPPSTALPRPPEAPSPSEARLEVLLERLREDKISLPDTIKGGPPTVEAVADMLDVRMLFSALVDADFVATEAHFNPEKSRLRMNAAPLNVANLRARLAWHLETIRARSPATSAVKAMREDLLSACVQAAEWSPGIFTLTAPTGSGKTLAMLRFALEHLERHGQRRIVVVLPYLSIIEQTASVYRAALSASSELVLEDHSLAGWDERETETDIAVAGSDTHLPLPPNSR